MNSLRDLLLNVDFLTIALPAAGAILAWYFNERSKLRSEQLQRKEERYKELLRCVSGFYTATDDLALKSQFIDQYKLCWLYAPDEVILKANAFFYSIHTDRADSPASAQEKERALADFILAIRKDMLGGKLTTRTALTPTDWKNFHVAPPGMTRGQGPAGAAGSRAGQLPTKGPVTTR